MFNKKKVARLEKELDGFKRLAIQQKEFIEEKCYFRNAKGQIQKC